MNYDDWKLATPPWYDEPDPPEELAILESAMAYLKPRADADEGEQLIGDFEAYEILLDARQAVLNKYEARNEPPWDTREEYREMR